VTAPNPQEASRNRRFLLVFITVFVVVSIGTTIYGFQVVERVKMQAARSDQALRLRAWSILATVDASGRFPTNESEADAHLDRAKLDGTLAEAFSSQNPGDFSLVGEAWPPTRVEAIGGLDAETATLDAETVGQIVVISWDPEGRLAPVLSVSGRPSGLVEGGTTLELVNRWLQRAGNHLGR